MVSTHSFLSSVVAALAVLAAAADAESSSSLPRVDAGVHRALRTQGTVDLIVTMKHSPKPTISQYLLEADFASRGEKIVDLVERLGNLSKVTQEPLCAMFAQESSDSETPLFKTTTSFWISNQFFFKGATFELVEKLSALSNLAEIREQLVLPVPTVTSAERNT
ncbi:hypothetical protein Gpo141_00011672, partial [Globisporangium polare]